MLEVGFPVVICFLILGFLGESVGIKMTLLLVYERWSFLFGNARLLCCVFACTQT